MIDILKRECFITVSVHNTGSQVVWVDLAEWRFSTDAGPVKRPHRNYWLNKWEKLGMPMPIRSTFRWTLLPERLDYQPGEREGGNIILPRVRDPIRLEATFSAGSGPGAERWTEHYRDLRCAVDQ
jgi:hypothetical protein